MLSQQDSFRVVFISLNNTKFEVGVPLVGFPFV